MEFNVIKESIIDNISTSPILIEDINFTKKEIDVLSCIISGYSNKVIAELLSISFRTVESHLRNIFTKIESKRPANGYPSRSTLIRFLENSRTYNLLKKNYFYILIESTLKDFLQMISSYNSSQDKTYCKIFLINNKNDFFGKMIERHLRRAGINSILREYSSFHEFKKPSRREKYNLKTILITDHPISKKEISNFKGNSKDFISIYVKPSSDKDLNLMSLDNPENYYVVLFQLISCFFPGEKVREVFKEFKEKSLNIFSNNYNSYGSTLNNNMFSPGMRSSSGKISPNLEKTLHSRNGYSKLILGAFIALVFFIPIIYFLTKNTPKTGSYEYTHKNGLPLTIPWNTPYMPEYFIKRENLRNKVSEKLKEQDNKLKRANIVGLNGLGGIGKTYLALDMIYNPIKEYSFRGWIPSNDENKIKEEYLKLGEELHLYADNAKEKSKISIVKNWLNNQESLLLIFDNAPNMDIIEKYMPTGGDIIITSINYKLPNTIEVDVMEESEAIELITSLIPKDTPFEKIQALVRELGYFPLALAQAGAYIGQNNFGIDNYLKLYHEKMASLFSSKNMPVLHKHLPFYIICTSILKEIKEKDKTGKAIELLNLISFYENTPKSFLIEYLFDSSESEATIKFNKIIEFLRQYSLIKVKPNTVSQHHLFKNCIRSTISPEKQKVILAKAINTMKKISSIKNKKDYDYPSIRVLERGKR